MSDAKFTPGPWPLETLPTACGVCHKIGVFPKTPDRTTAACVYVDYNAHSDELLANARLIAAAPDLYEALQGMLRIVADSRGVSGYHLNGDVAEWSEFEEVEAAMQALAKVNQP